MSCKLSRGPRWALSTSQRCVARQQVTLLRLMRQSCLLLRRTVVVLENSLRGGHRAEVRATTRMPPEGYKVILHAGGGGCPPSFLLQSNLPWCPCTPKPRMSLLLGQMCTCFLVWPSPQNNFWKKQNVRNLFLGKWDCKYGQTYFVTTTVNSSLNSSVLKYYFFIFSQKRKGKQNSYMVYIDSYVRYIHGGADICWHDQISSAQISADICKYLRISADIFYEGTCVQYNFFCSKNNYHVFAAACKLRAP